MSQKSSGFERMSSDQYMTPEWPVLSLLSVEPIFGQVWEPACGEGMISNTVARSSPYVRVVGSDLYPQGSEPPVDFLAHLPSDHPIDKGPLTIITNPPYGKQGRLALAFVNHAIELTKITNGKVIMLLPVDWDSAKGRAHLFGNFKGHVRKIILTERIRWTNLPQSKSGPSQNHAWFIWNHAGRGTAMHWIGRVKGDG